MAPPSDPTLTLPWLVSASRDYAYIRHARADRLGVDLSASVDLMGTRYVCRVTAMGAADLYGDRAGRSMYAWFASLVEGQRFAEAWFAALPPEPWTIVPWGSP